MKHLTQYTYSCTDVMFRFLNDADITKLVTKLKNIELHAKDSIADSYEKSLWFKFGSDDTLSTTIQEIEHTLAMPITNQNRQLLIEQFEMVTEDIEPKKELRVFFS